MLKIQVFPKMNTFELGKMYKIKQNKIKLFEICMNHIGAFMLCQSMISFEITFSRFLWTPDCYNI